MNRLRIEFGKFPIDIILLNAIVFVVEVIIGGYVNILIIYHSIKKFMVFLINIENNPMHKIIGKTLYKLLKDVLCLLLCHVSKNSNYFGRLPFRCVTNILQVMPHVVNGQTKKTNGLLCQILTKIIVGLGLN